MSTFPGVAIGSRALPLEFVFAAFAVGRWRRRGGALGELKRDLIYGLLTSANLVAGQVAALELQCLVGGKLPIFVDFDEFETSQLDREAAGRRVHEQATDLVGVSCEDESDGFGLTVPTATLSSSATGWRPGGVEGQRGELDLAFVARVLAVAANRAAVKLDCQETPGFGGLSVGGALQFGRLALGEQALDGAVANGALEFEQGVGGVGSVRGC